MSVGSLSRALVGLAGAAVALVVLAPAALLASPFVLVAGTTRVLRRLFEPRSTHWSRLVEFAPVVGWRPKPNVDAYAWGGDAFRVRTDAEGWRGDTRIDQSRVVVFGDSFAFGHGASDSDYFANLGGSIRIKAVGVNGYNMVQELLWVRRLASRLQGKLVVWFVYYGNDLDENLRPNMEHYRAPFVRRGCGSTDWEVVTDHVTPEPWYCTGRCDYYKRLAQICGETALSDRAFSAAEYLIREGLATCGAAGAELVVFGIPDPAQLTEAAVARLRGLSTDPGSFDPARPDRRLADACASMGVSFVPLRAHLTEADYKPNDVHWTRSGHRKVAALLVALATGHRAAVPHAPAGSDAVLA